MDWKSKCIADGRLPAPALRRSAVVTLMYTLHMSWSFRTLALGVVVAWGLGPQLACFMPDQALTRADMDCCKGMAGDCNSANMSQACCQTAVRTEVGVAAKVVRHVMPRLDVAAATTSTVPDVFFAFDRQPARQKDHAPPDSLGNSSPVLRI
jgi:hypothetical protein